MVGHSRTKWQLCLAVAGGSLDLMVCGTSSLIVQLAYTLAGALRQTMIAGHRKENFTTNARVSQDISGARRSLKRRLG